MTDTDQSGYPRRTADRAPEPTGWAGWVVFAGILMIMLGAYQAILGFVALFDDGYYVVRPEGLVVNVDYTAWGWVHLLLGLVAFFAGFGVISGQTWARAVGIIIALVSAIVNFAFVAAFPIWATILITIDILIIYALAAHGRELRA
jgi:hypothetical protein